MNVSVLSYSFRGLLAEGKMDLFGYLETCKYRYHLSAADIWSGFFPSTNPDYLKKVKEELDERELVLADLCVDNAHVWDSQPDVRERNYQNARTYLKVADTLGARFMRVDAGSREDTWTDEELDHIVMRYKEYAQWAYDHGFLVGIENHWGPERAWQNLKQVYEAVDHPGFGVSCHIGGWAGTPEEVAEADRLVASWVSHTHIAWNICEGDLMAKLKNLWNVGYKGYYSVEHHSAKNEYSEVAIQLAKVRDVLDKLHTGND
jgi:sugar phosphate isomerase/epimerase